MSYNQPLKEKAQKAVGGGNFVYGVFLCFQKVFTKVSHEILLSKLEPNPFSNLSGSYIKNWTHFVQITQILFQYNVEFLKVKLLVWNAVSAKSWDLFSWWQIEIFSDQYCLVSTSVVNFLTQLNTMFFLYFVFKITISKMHNLVGSVAPLLLINL